MPRTSDFYFKILTALFVAAAAFLTARLVSEIVASAIWVPSALEARVEPQRAAQAKAETEEEYQVIQTRNLFNDTPPPPGSPLGDQKPAAAAPAPAPPPAPPAPPPPVVDFNLVGTVFMSKGGSTAIFTRGDQTLIKREGMEITPGITLASVSRDKVVVTIGQDRTDLQLFVDRAAGGARGARPGRAGAAQSPPRAGSASAQPSAPPFPDAQSSPYSPSQSGGNENIRQIGSTSWAIDRREVDSAIANLSQLITQLRVVPNLVDGQTQGFKIFNIRPGSLFSQIGLVDGDVIREINGVQMSGIDVAYQAMSSLQNQTSLQVGITRANQPLTLSYEIR